jgi:hypothetical protein
MNKMVIQDDCPTFMADLDQHKVRTQHSLALHTATGVAAASAVMHLHLYPVLLMRLPSCQGFVSSKHTHPLAAD